MKSTTTDTPPVFLRPAVDDGFFGRGDFELRQEEFRAVVRVRPRGRTWPARSLPALLEDLPTEPVELELCDGSEDGGPGSRGQGRSCPDHRPSADDRTHPWRLPEDLIPTFWNDLPNPVEVLPRAAMEALRPRLAPPGMVTARHRVGTFVALSSRPTPSWNGMGAPPWDEEPAGRVGWVDAVGLPAIVAAVAGLVATAALLL